MTTLSTYERGLALAAVRALGRRAAVFLRPYGSHVAAAAALLASDEAERGREIARLDAAPPDGIERVHPSWWQRPPASSIPAAQKWLERAATAHLVPMRVPDLHGGPQPRHGEAGAPSAAAVLTALDAPAGDKLAQLISSLGRRRVAVAFFEMPRSALAQLCARLGEPAASELVAEVKSISPEHEEVRSAQRALFRLAVDVPDARALFASAGARWLAPALASLHGDLLRRVAQRLPRPLGAALIAEAGGIATDADVGYCAAAVAALAK